MKRKVERLILDFGQKIFVNLKEKLKTKIKSYLVQLNNSLG